MLKPIILDVECIVCNKSLQKINHDPGEAKRNMGKINNRRSRTPNWSIEEKKCLLDLIKQRKELVVTKNNNGPNYSEEKDVAWNEILGELTVRFGTKFAGSSIKKVKTQWQNMKRIAREEIAAIGSNLDKFSLQSLEVCSILDLVKDGQLKRDHENFNDTVMAASVEIKTERLDEDFSEVSNTIVIEPPVNLSMHGQCQIDGGDVQIVNTTTISNNTSMSECMSLTDLAEPQTQNGISLKEHHTKNAAVMTENTNEDDANNVNNLGQIHRKFKEFLNHASEEKQLKMESLKEERLIVKAMRETAELNKIIAEQRLKHMLWIKKREFE
ncbi:hypothetical protein ACJJTC_015569 [Scirpophaga incertulas]